ncbi:MAG: hypothetical protein PHP50_08210 [Lachnospiraceae bacterium]|nr:hypothetical protein [Lachnospiraceae bacterium]
MSDWNQNGSHDSFDSYMDYSAANSSSSGRTSDTWMYFLILLAVSVCPPLAIIIFIAILLFKH